MTFRKDFKCEKVFLRYYKNPRVQKITRQLKKGLKTLSVGDIQGKLQLREMTELKRNKYHGKEIGVQKELVYAYVEGLIVKHKGSCKEKCRETAVKSKNE